MEQKSFLNTIDNRIIGFIIGLLLPIIMFILYHNLKFGYMNFDEYLKFTTSFSMLPSIIKICVFINFPIFLLANFIKKFNLCIGIFIASMLYILAMFMIKYLI